MKPKSKWDQKVDQDRKAAPLFQGRRDAEKYHERRELQRNTREVWE
ncbi:hypothetical protein [Modicisalibacter coralii]|nr:hypothetical protein [Halomonas coralii]